MYKNILIAIELSDEGLWRMPLIVGVTVTVNCEG